MQNAFCIKDLRIFIQTSPFLYVPTLENTHVYAMSITKII
jgi:hypothetical protein